MQNASYGILHTAGSQKIVVSTYAFRYRQLYQSIYLCASVIVPECIIKERNWQWGENKMNSK